MTSSSVACRLSSFASAIAPVVALSLAAGCSGGGGITSGAGGSASGGTASSGGSTSNGGATGNGGAITSGGTTGTGDTTGKGGPTGTGGETAAGGITSSGGSLGRDGGSGSGGTLGSGGGRGGGPGAGGVAGAGGVSGRDGGPGSGGAPGTGGSTTDGGTANVNCSATMPSGGTQHSGSSQGGSGDLTWSLWQNGSGGSITTFTTTAFSASWGSSSGDFLARMGLEWGNNSKAYTAYGTITAQFAETKSGSGGGFSYIGIYGWSTNPCVEWYIVDDSFGTMPFNAYGATLKGTVSIDGENYKLFSNSTTGTGGNRCGNVTSWTQFWSIRQKARQCGQISITQHFDAWNAAGMTLGNLLEAKILVEAGGGNGSINFPIANVTAN